ncbi:unnamed protein product [Hyaloperonospora brassicae]|uniref:AB hydrolase-1 domain-containing protein n=1 Tax=Hyaloperonospora brassicae TaxID=162125 RepID=A0AAV0T9V9_HYABA|nr:unnamed protein product [Hyaloperonospora brassicae]
MGFSRVLSAFRFSTTNLVRVGKRFEARSATIDQFQWSYLIRPAADPTSREVVVFLHGLGSSKEAWQTDKRGDCTEFFESELYPNNKVHLVGTCIGATVAGLYAAMHPTRVKSLALMCPWGIAVPTATSATLSDMELLDKLTLQSPTATSASEVGEWRDPTVNVKHMLRALRALTTYKRGREWQVLQKVGMDTLAHPSILEDSLGSIRARTIVVWGKEDAVLDAACLEVIDDKLNVTHKHVLALEDCGHLITSDKPSECIDLLNRFLGNLQLSCSPALAEQASAMAFEPLLPSQD